MTQSFIYQSQPKAVARIWYEIALYDMISYRAAAAATRCNGRPETFFRKFALKKRPSKNRIKTNGTKILTIFHTESSQDFSQTKFNYFLFSAYNIKISNLTKADYMKLVVIGAIVVLPPVTLAMIGGI